MSEAAYAHEVVEGVIVPFDRSAIERSRPVTNSIERVPAEVAAEVGGLKDRPVIYRDSDGVLDGVLQGHGHFFGFCPIGERVPEPALAAARQPQPGSVGGQRVTIPPVARVGTGCSHTVRHGYTTPRTS